MRWPWHHKHKPKKNIAATPQILQGLQLSSSAVGLAIPLVYGQARLPGNLIHYKQNFLASGNSDPANAAIAMAICEGAITGILKAYNDKDQTDSQSDVFNSGTQFTPGTTTSLTLSRTPISGTVFLSYPASGISISTVVGSVVTFTAPIPLGTLAVVLTYQFAGSLATRGFTTFLGTLAQAPWPFLTSQFNSEAVPYELTAYIANPSWPIPNNQLENWSFEVAALLQWGSGIVDSNPKDIVTDFLTDANHGALFPSAQLGDLTAFRDYCTAAGIFLSPVFDTQRPAMDHLQEILAVANSAFVWSDGKLKIVPYADSVVSGNSVVYTPNVTPLYNLTDDDFIAAEGEDPVRVTRRAQSDVYNMVQVEFDNRATDYVGDIAEAKDQASIEQYLLKPAPVIKAPYIKTAALARFVAQLALQRQVYIRNTYEFSLGFRYVLLEPMDLVTLTDSNLGLNQTTVRLTAVEEQDDGSFACTAEEWPFGVATAAAYNSPGTTGTPRIFPSKVPDLPGVTVSFDVSGQAILNLTGDARTVSHKYVLRTDRLPTLAETRAGTTASGSSVSSIATGVVVAAGASVYVGDLALNSIGGESALSVGTYLRQGSGTSAPPVPFITPLNTEGDSTIWNIRFDAVAGSGGGGSNLTYVIKEKHGTATENTLSSGNATAFPLDLAIARDVQYDKLCRFFLTDVATGITIVSPFLVAARRDEMTTVGGIVKFRRTVNFDDDGHALFATEPDGTTKTSTAISPQGSIIPAPVDATPFSYNSGGAVSGRMWLAWTWVSITIWKPDGTTIVIPASTSLPAPPSPTLSQVVSGALAGRTRFVRIGYVKNGMIYRVGAEASLAISANNLLKVTSPASVPGMDGWCPLVGSATNTEFTQSSVAPSFVAFGTDWTEPSSGADISGQTPFDVTNWPGGVIAIGLNASSTFFYYPWWDIAATIIAFADRGQTVKVASSAVKQNLDGRVALSAGGMAGATPAAGFPGNGAGGGSRFL